MIENDWKDFVAKIRQCYVESPSQNKRKNIDFKFNICKVPVPQNIFQNLSPQVHGDGWSFSSGIQHRKRTFCVMVLCCKFSYKKKRQQLYFIFHRFVVVEINSILKNQTLQLVNGYDVKWLCFDYSSNLFIWCCESIRIVFFNCFSNLSLQYAKRKP